MPHRLHLSLALGALFTFVLAARTSVLAGGTGEPAVERQQPGAAQQPVPEQQPAGRQEPTTQQPAVPQQPAVAQAQSISGAWMLNHDMSDRQPAMAPGGDESGGEGGRGGRRAGMGGGRMGGMRGGGEGRGNPEAMKEARETMQELMQPSERLTITQTPDEVTFTDADGRIRHYSATGKKEKHQLLAGVVETKTVWKEGQLVMESQPQGGGMKVIQTYFIDPKTHQLVVSTAMQGAGRSMPPIRRVYDNVMDVR